jgi:outer membrane protein assembly factor BamB
MPMKKIGGMLFVGGGYGSHEFYAFNAETSARVWTAKTSDDGPTAAAVEDGYVGWYAWGGSAQHNKNE